ncbi:Ig-like domain-containing protein [Vibrio sp. YMD68]|uniref:Ig-like domain-containing protein n=1 Tax=Vibrio sp. YMD68 TaxID=3042300 RepID=UPI00249BCDDA|nr:Ig-like domain-containing protein [Vibrio sp. YMD68]WGW01368.1 Ig-like domain-containing protein [Vibrio sp. YMD68]
MRIRSLGLVLMSAVVVLSGCRSSIGEDVDTGAKQDAILLDLVVSSKENIALGVPVGYQQEFIAMAEYSDSSTEDVSDLAVWLSSDEDGAIMDGAVLMALAEGSVAISASFNDLASSNAVDVEIVPAVLESIVIDISTPKTPVGLDIQLIANGLFGDGFSRPLQGGVWSSSDELIAKVSAQGVVTPVVPGSVVITVEKEDKVASVDITVTDAELVSIQLEPSATSTPLGQSVQMIATGEYTDGTTAELTGVSWVSSTPATATVSNSGLVTPVALGTTVITATKDGEQASTVSFEVTAAELVSIQLEPSATSTPLGQSVQMIATGEYTDGTTAELTGVSWVSSTPATATVSNSGLVTPVALGTTVITATKDGEQASTVSFEVTAAELVSIQLEPSATSTPLGQSVQMIATGEYTDGTTAELTGVSWVSSTPATATVSNSGLVTPVALGTTVITATKDGEQASTVSFEVTAAELVSIQLEPSVTSTPLGQSVQMIATGEYTDGTTAELTGVSWVSTTPATATVSNSGLVTPVALGTTVITAMKDGEQASTVSFEVTAAELVSIQLEPSVTSTPVGQSVQMIATGEYTDGTTAELTGVSWVSSTPATATVSNSGLVTPVALGTTVITATKDGEQASTVSFEVTAAELVSIQLEPSVTSTPLGQSVQMIATGEYTDGTTAELTGVSWVSSTPATATVSNSGLVTPVALGRTVITATKDGEQASTVSFEVTAAELVSIQLEPSVTSTPLGQSVQMIATGEYTDGTTAELTGVSWVSTTPATATVSNSGLVTPVALGTTVITATKGGEQASTVSFEVTAAELVSIQLEPSATSTPLGQSVQMIATGEYTDGTTAELTGVSWVSSTPATATVSNSGLVTPVSVGTTVITATKDGEQASTVSFEVTAAELVSIQLEPSVTSTPLDQSVQMIATGEYTDGTTAELTGVSWVSSVPATATVSNSGLVTPVSVGTTVITATKDGEQASTVSFEVTAIDTVKLGNLTFHRALAKAEAVAKGFTPDGWHTVGGSTGPDGMVVSAFNWSNADNFCENVEMGGYSDWRLPSRDELTQLQASTQAGVFVAFGWPIYYSYWSSTLDTSYTGTRHYSISLTNGYAFKNGDLSNNYVSCVRAD